MLAKIVNEWPQLPPPARIDARTSAGKPPHRFFTGLV